ncbi:MAG: ATP-binding protein [Acidobacteriota bacterium]
MEFSTGRPATSAATGGATAPGNQPVAADRVVADSAPFGIYHSTSDGGFAAVNLPLVALLGYDSREELLAIPQARLYSASCEQTRVVDAFKGKMFGRAETEWKRKDGRGIAVSLVGRAIDQDRRGAAGHEIFVEDTSRRRLSEEQLRQSQKMEAIGQLAAGVAHDFNNLLTVILGYTDMLLDQLGGAQRISHDLAEIKRAADRASLLTRQLLAFGRKQNLRMAVVDLNQVIVSVEGMIRRLIQEDITIHFHLGVDARPVLADVSQLEQVMMNLAVNGRDAMPQGGTLTFETRVVVLDNPDVLSDASAAPGVYTMFSVTDTGVGMDADTAKHIFEPFFTTKASGKGTGLGLATVYGIVRQLDGYIVVDSDAGRGTTFKLYFPAVAPEHKEIAEAAESKAGAPLGREVILLVEDDEGVRELAAATLKRFGYHVLETSSGAEALNVLSRTPWHLDLLLTDVIMPNMTGADLAARVRSARQETRVLYMSGYTAEALTSNGTLVGEVELLEKPFSPRALLDRVRALLDRPPSIPPTPPPGD